jgi:hypothetical protein
MLENIFSAKAAVEPFPLPPDLTDQFFYSAWRYPEKYLDAQFRKGISVFALADQNRVNACTDRLQADLANGAWDRKYGSIRSLSSYDGGYRFIYVRKT